MFSLGHNTISIFDYVVLIINKCFYVLIEEKQIRLFSLCSCYRHVINSIDFLHKNVYDFSNGGGGDNLNVNICIAPTSLDVLKVPQFYLEV